MILSRRSQYRLKLNVGLLYTGPLDEHPRIIYQYSRLLESSADHDVSVPMVQFRVHRRPGAAYHIKPSAHVGDPQPFHVQRQRTIPCKFLYVVVRIPDKRKKAFNTTLESDQKFLMEGKLEPSKCLYALCIIFYMVCHDSILVIY